MIIEIVVVVHLI